MKYIKQFFKSFSAFFTLQDNEMGLFLPRRHMSWVLAIITLLTLVSFTAGYFMGHQSALETFVKQLEEDSFADKVNYSLYALSDSQQEVEQEAEAEQDARNEGLDQEDNSTEEETIDKQQVDHAVQAVRNDMQEKEQDLHASKNMLASVDTAVHTTVSLAPEDTLFIAPVAGFGTLRAAQDFVQRVQLYDAGMTVKKRVSINKHGKKIVWYQAVTSEFASREALENVIKIIKKTEHIAHVNIIERKVTRTC